MRSPGSNTGEGKDYLEEESWQKMGTKTSTVSAFMEKLNRRMNGSIFNFDAIPRFQLFYEINCKKEIGNLTIKPTNRLKKKLTMRPTRRPQMKLTC